MARRDREDAAVVGGDGKRRRTDKAKEAAEESKAAAAGREGKRRRTVKTKEPEVAAEVIDVWSLRSAQALAAQVPGPAVVNIRTVEVHQAAGLLVLLHRQEMSKGWRLRKSHSRRLVDLVHLDALLAVGIDAHVPIVMCNFFIAGYLCELREWTWDLQSAARGVNTDLYNGATQACNKVRKFVRRALKLVRRANPDADNAAHRAAAADPASRYAAYLAVCNVVKPADIKKLAREIEDFETMLRDLKASTTIFPAARRA